MSAENPAVFPVQLFPGGQIVATPNALATVSPDAIQPALARHFAGDWGDTCAEDKALNDEAVKLGNRILSVYHDSQHVKFWIITEADRSATTILLPEDY